jgi:FkbM family methyltransferase
MSFINNAKYLFSIPAMVWLEPSNRDERIKRVFMSIFWQLWKRFKLPPLIYNLDNGAYFVLDPKSGNSVGAIYTKIYSSRHVRFVRKHIVPNGLMVDVGAHAGLYTLLFLHQISGAVCFEPAPDTIRLLRRNILLNDINAEIKELAVGERSGNCFFTITGNNSATNFIGRTGLQLPMTCLDDSLEGITNLSFLKIDVEGGEENVLKGAVHLLKSNPRAIVQVEITGDKEPIVDTLRASGFRVYGVDIDGRPQEYGGMAHLIDDLVAFGPKHPFNIADYKN